VQSTSHLTGEASLETLRRRVAFVGLHGGVVCRDGKSASDRARRQVRDSGLGIAAKSVGPLCVACRGLPDQPARAPAASLSARSACASAANAVYRSDLRAGLSRLPDDEGSLLKDRDPRLVCGIACSGACSPSVRFFARGASHCAGCLADCSGCHSLRAKYRGTSAKREYGNDQDRVLQSDGRYLCSPVR